MGVLILGCVMIFAAFLAALGVAAFFAHHFWRLQRAYEQDHARHVAYVTGKVPYDHEPPKQGEHVAHAFDDRTEAAIEQAVHDQLPAAIMGLRE